MEWYITTKSGKVKLTATQVVAMLADKVKKSQKPYIDALAYEARRLFPPGMMYSLSFSDEGEPTLQPIDPTAFIHFGLMLGHYYQVFLEKNKVDIRSPNESDQDTSNSGNEAPTGSGSSASSS